MSEVSTTEQVVVPMDVVAVAPDDDRSGVGGNVTSTTEVPVDAEQVPADASTAISSAAAVDSSIPDDATPTSTASDAAAGPEGSGPEGSGPEGSGPEGSGPAGSGPAGSGPTADPARLHYEGDTCVYTDPGSGAQYTWDAAAGRWQSRPDSADYEWDAERKAWFPKVDAEFLARYQLSYDFSDPEARRREAELEEQKRAEREKAEAEAAAKKKAAPKDPTWFEPDAAHNSKVYVSNLPTDVTEPELAEFMQKCGLLAREDNGRIKVKLYAEPGDERRLKGDALCTYIKVESVELALSLLDGSDLRGNKVSVQRATFQMKGNYDPSLKPKKKRRKDKDKAKKQQESLFDWRPDRMRGERGKHERTVVVKNLFDAKQFEQDVSLILEFNQDLREECAKCGTVRKLVIYDRHPEGVATVTFSDPAEADLCLRLLNLRWFGQRRITAETWDGKTKYKVAETEAEAKARLSKWDNFLVTDEAAPGAATEVPPIVEPSPSAEPSPTAEAEASPADKASDSVAAAKPADESDDEALTASPGSDEMTD